jgi:GT2 family glycosyltransferase
VEPDDPPAAEGRSGLMPPDLSVIIVAYRCRDVLAECLKSLGPERDTSSPARGGASPERGGSLATASLRPDPPRGEAAPAPTESALTAASQVEDSPWRETRRARSNVRLAVEIIVVDNASGDGTAQMVRERFSPVHLIANASNRGFAAANNQGLAVASGQHVLFLNPDTLVHPGAPAAMVGTLEADEKIGVCGPQILNADGSIQPSARRFPDYGALLHQYTPLRLLRLCRGAYRRYKMADFDFSSAADVESLMGAAMCVPRRVLEKVGAFDERFFVYLEEVDLCRRIREAGYRVRFEPAGRITHLGGVSAASATASLFFCRSLFRYIRKYHGPATGRVMVFLLRFGMFVREGMLMIVDLAAAGMLALVGRTERARRRMASARSAARFVFRDGWLSFLKA